MSLFIARERQRLVLVECSRGFPKRISSLSLAMPASKICKICELALSHEGMPICTLPCGHKFHSLCLSSQEDILDEPIEKAPCAICQKIPSDTKPGWSLVENDTKGEEPKQKKMRHTSKVSPAATSSGGATQPSSATRSGASTS